MPVWVIVSDKSKPSLVENGSAGKNGLQFIIKFSILALVNSVEDNFVIASANARLEFGGRDPRETESITITIRTDRENIRELFDFIRKLGDPKIVANTRIDDGEIEITLQNVGT